MYQNRATLIGFLGKNAEVKTTRHKATFVVLSLATKRSWKDRESGDRMSETTWHRCIVWGNLSRYAATLVKGAHIEIEGHIRTHSHQPRSSSSASGLLTEIRVTSITSLARSKKAESREAAP